MSHFVVSHPVADLRSGFQAELWAATHGWSVRLGCADSYSKKESRANMLSACKRASKSISPILCFLFFLPAICRGQQASEQIRAATTQLKQTLSTLKIPDDLKSSDDTIKVYTDALKVSEDALQSGYIYLALFRLESNWEAVRAFQYCDSKSAVEKQGVAAFEKEWQKAGKQVAQKEKLLASASPRPLPAAVTALIESTRNQSRPYYDSSKLYGINSTINSGLYYVGSSLAGLDFALFCQQLRFDQMRPAPKLRSLEPEIKELEAATIAAFRNVGAETDQSPFYSTSSNLKAAEEMNRAGRFSGALLKYLEASLYFGFINPAPQDINRLDSLKQQSESLGKRLTAADRDHSIGLIYWERAQVALTRAAAGEALQLNLRRASVLLEQVLPRYFKYLGESK